MNCGASTALNFTGEPCGNELDIRRGEDKVNGPNSWLLGRNDSPLRNHHTVTELLATRNVELLDARRAGLNAQHPEVYANGMPPGERNKWSPGNRIGRYS